MRWLLAVTGCTLAFGCGSVMVEPATTSTGGSGPGTTSSVATGGSGGVLIVTTTTPTCDDPTVFIDFDDGSGVVTHLGADCAPEGLFTTSGPTPGAALVIRACSTQPAPYLLLLSAVQAWPGTTTDALIDYHPGSQQYQGHAATLTVSSLGEVGGVIEGTFSGEVVQVPSSPGTPPLTMSGKLRVCRMPDQIVL